MPYPSGFLFLALPISPNWNASTEWLVVYLRLHFVSLDLLLLSVASLPPLRVTLTYFTLSSCKRVLRLPTFFPISGLFSLGMKPKLCRSFWRAIVSTHPLMLPPTFPRELFFACTPTPLRTCPPLLWNPLFFSP